MNTWMLLPRQWISALCLATLSFLSHADSIPVWTIFEPQSSTDINVPANGTATIVYKITNNSYLSHTMTLKPTPGLSQVTGPGFCTVPFVLDRNGGSCMLKIQIDGAQVQNGLTGGPIICQTSSVLAQCYQPNEPDILHIHVTPGLYSVSATLNNVTTTSTNPQTIIGGNKASFIVTANTGYTTDTSVGGNCPIGTWSSSSTYTTGTINSSCTVTFTATANTNNRVLATFTDDNATTSSTNPQTVTTGNKARFIVTAKTGYTTDTSVGGDCPIGTWSSSTYTTGIINRSCSVTFTATANTNTVTATAGANETITPTSTTVVTPGTVLFTVATDPNYYVNTLTAPTNNCGVTGGQWSSTGQTLNTANYITGYISSSCHFTFSPANIRVNATTGPHFIAISPTSPVAVLPNTTTAFTFTLDPGYQPYVSSTTCPTGSWNGLTYTTGTITAPCSIIFDATPQQFTITVNAGPDITIAPANSYLANYYDQVEFALSPSSGYYIVDNGTTCTGGTYNTSSGNITSPVQTSTVKYTTAPITQNCTISYTAVSQVSTVPSEPIYAYVTIDPTQNHPTLTIHWSTPINDGTNGGTPATPITGYQITDANHPSTVYTSQCNPAIQATSTSCTLPLSTFTAGTSPIFQITAQNMIGSSPPGFTSPVIIPASSNGVANPQILGLNANGNTRAITFNFPYSVKILSTVFSAPSSGGGTKEDFQQAIASNTCTPGSSITSCQIGINPNISSLNCHPLSSYPYSGAAYNSSQDEYKITITPDIGAPIAASIYFERIGCGYQNGVVFDIDDNAPANQSIAGKVSGYNILPQSPWAEPTSSTTPTWGISSTSKNTDPSPSATFYLGQQNCGAGTTYPFNHDGFCNTYNILLDPQYTTSSTAKTCIDLNSAGHFYGWYLPSACEVVESIEKPLNHLPVSCPDHHIYQNYYTNFNSKVFWSSNLIPESSCGPEYFPLAANSYIVNLSSCQAYTTHSPLICAKTLTI